MQRSTLLYKYKRKLTTLLGCDLWIRFKSCAITNDLKLNVLFFGTDQFSLKSLILLDNYSKCKNSKINRIDVVTSYRGKGNPVKQYAEKNGIDCWDWVKLSPNSAKIKYDLGIVVSFGHLIPESIINMFPFGMINVHASLLPRWRGASPIIYAILNEDVTTGVSLMKIHPHKFDVGEILAQKEIEIPKNVLMPELHTELAQKGGELLVNCIENAPESLQNGRQQGSGNISYAPRIPDSMANVDWNKMTARHICNLYRALYSFKWLKTHWHERRVKIRELDLSAPSEPVVSLKMLPGTVEYDKDNKCLIVYCSDGYTVRIKRLVLEGKSTMTAADFNNGFLKKVDITQRFFT